MSTSPVNMNSSNAASASAASSSAASSSASSSAANASAQSAMDALGNPDTFLQLLVAQLQYQDPESPADGTTFVTQLATFAGVEEQSAMRSDLDSINNVAQQWSASQSAASAATTPAATTDPSAATGTNPSSGTAPSTGTTPATTNGNAGTSN